MSNIRRTEEKKMTCIFDALITMTDIRRGIDEIMTAFVTSDSLSIGTDMRR